MFTKHTRMTKAGVTQARSLMLLYNGLTGVVSGVSGSTSTKKAADLCAIPPLAFGLGRGPETA